MGNEHFDDLYREQSHLDAIVACSGSYVANNWTQAAETAMPLKASKLSSPIMASHRDQALRASIELRSAQIADRVILVNVISLIVNLVLALAAFYLSFINSSPSTTAFAADCVLDSISCAIVLWRYYGDANSLYVHAREQIACIYLGALFEISAIAIIIKTLSDIASGADYLQQVAQADAECCELLYLAAIATVACTVITIFKCFLFKVLRESSILLDVINSLISTVFALSIVVSQTLINFDPAFWYLDPVLSIILASFMAFFGLKVILSNFNVLKPIRYGELGDRSSSNEGLFSRSQERVSLIGAGNNWRVSDRSNNYRANLSLSLQDEPKSNGWQRAGYSSINLV